MKEKKICNFFPPQVPKVQKKIVNIPVEIITEKIVEVPKIIKEEEIIERKIESTVVKPVFVEVPQIQERIFQQPGEDDISGRDIIY